MIKVLLLVSILFNCSPAWAEDYSGTPIIDEQYREIEMEIKKVRDECWAKEKSIPKKMKCGQELRNKYEREGMIRGTSNYCRRHYAPLSFDELRKRWLYLKQQHSVARTRVCGDEIVLGEVNKAMFWCEITWVESRLARLQQERIEAGERELFGEPRRQ